MITSPLTKDRRSSSTSTPILAVHSEEEEEEEESQMNAEITPTVTSSSGTRDEKSTNVLSAKSVTSSNAQASMYVSSSNSESQVADERYPSTVQQAKPVSAQVRTVDEQNLGTAKGEKVDRPVAKALTSSLTKDDEPSKLRSIQSPMLREDTSAGATTSYMCTNSGMVFAYKRPSSCEIDRSLMTENDCHVSTFIEATP